jgi:hypothetical protein
VTDHRAENHAQSHRVSLLLLQSRIFPRPDALALLP